MNGHFLMFNKMLDILEEPLIQELIKAFHFELKSGVFEDRANGYAIGDYKKRPNMIVLQLQFYLILQKLKWLSFQIGIMTKP